MSTWDDKPNDYEHALIEIARLRTALERIRTLDHAKEWTEDSLTNVVAAHIAIAASALSK